jgi:replication initiation and membrane attachment protein DnaB
MLCAKVNSSKRYWYAFTAVEEFSGRSCPLSPEKYNLLEKTGVQVTSRGLSSLSAAEKRLSPRTVLREIAAEKNLHEPVCRLQLNFSFKKLQML